MRWNARHHNGQQNKQTLYCSRCSQQDTDSREDGLAEWIRVQGMLSEAVKMLAHNHGHRIRSVHKTHCSK